MLEGLGSFPLSAEGIALGVGETVELRTEGPACVEAPVGEMVDSGAPLLLSALVGATSVVGAGSCRRFRPGLPATVMSIQNIRHSEANNSRRHLGNMLMACGTGLGVPGRANSGPGALQLKPRQNGILS